MKTISIFDLLVVVVKLLPFINSVFFLSLGETDSSQLSPHPSAGLFVARQALSCLLSLDGSAHILSLLSVDAVNAVLR